MRKKRRGDQQDQGQKQEARRLFLDTLFLLCNQAFSLERSHAATARRGNSLTIPLILDITSSKYTFYARLSRSGDSDDVAIRVGLELTTDEGGRRLVSDGVEETVDGEVLLLTSEDVLDAEVVEQIAVTLALDCDGVPEDGHFGVVHQALRHDLGRTKLAPANEDVNVRAVFCKV